MSILWVAGQELPRRQRAMTAERMRWHCDGLESALAGYPVSSGPNIHTDDDLARANGLPGRVADGMISTNWLSGVLLEAFGDGYLRHGTLRTRYLRPVFVDTDLTAVVRGRNGRAGSGRRPGGDGRRLVRDGRRATGHRGPGDRRPLLRPPARSWPDGRRAGHAAVSGSGGPVFGGRDARGARRRPATAPSGGAPRRRRRAEDVPPWRSGPGGRPVGHRRWDPNRATGPPGPEDDDVAEKTGSFGLVDGRLEAGRGTSTIRITRSSTPPGTDRTRRSIRPGGGQ